MYPERLFGRDRKRFLLGWRRNVLVAHPAAASHQRGPLVKTYDVIALLTSPSHSMGWVPDLILGEYDLLINGFAVERDGVLVDTFDFPAFLGVNPGVGFGFVGTAHAAYDALAQACAQIL